MKLKAISFFKAGESHEIIRKGEGLVLCGELEDSRPVTQVVYWDCDIEVHGAGVNPAVTTVKT